MTAKDTAGHAFISYAPVDTAAADRLQAELEAVGVRVWRDIDLLPGAERQIEIRRAINDGAIAFIACFSTTGMASRAGHQYEELILAIEQVRTRLPGETWLIPVRFDDCQVPDLNIGAGRTLRSIQAADLFGNHIHAETERLITSILRGLRNYVGPTGPARVSRDRAGLHEGRAGDTAANPLRIIRKLSLWQRIISWNAAIRAALLSGIFVLMAGVVPYLLGAYSATPRAPSLLGPPVLVENVTGIYNLGDLDGDFAFPSMLLLNAKQSATLNHLAVPDTARYTRWFWMHNAAGLSPAIFSITVRGNEPGGVRIVNMRLVKHCGDPYRGTIFFFSTQTGGPGPTVKIGFNLDSVDPIPQAMGGTSSGIGNFLGYNYFARNYINLARGEVSTFTIAAVTNRFSCSFRVQLILATSSGTSLESITDSGKPFRLTAGAPPERQDYYFSGYRSAYAYIADSGTRSHWRRLNPARINGAVCYCEDIFTSR